MKLVRKIFEFGDEKVTLETGRIARQATAAVMVTMGETAVLVTVVGNKSIGAAKDFFPLTVNYLEKTYATGRIPGGFFKREGKPSEKETLTSRLIDRPIRPLFPKGFNQEVQVVVTVMSATKDRDPDIAAMLGASAALAISGMPFQGPIAAARVGFQEGNYILNPSYKVLQESALDLIVAGTESAVLMVESEAKELTEDQMLGAVLFGHQEMQVAIQAIKEFQQEVNPVSWNWQPVEKNQSLVQDIKAHYEQAITEIYAIADKLERRSRLEELKNQAIERMAQSESGITAEKVQEAFYDLEKRIVRARLLANEARIDGRDTKTVRPISIETGILPRVHGSALFTRGETQVIVAATLGGQRDAQLIDALEGERRDNFMLHYNFPPYSVGEIGQVGAPKRREIGHGRLARRGIQTVLPDVKDFPYTIRVVSEVTESNGSSSMATVCGSSLALMHAGVPVKRPVAGIAMGLVKEQDKFVVLTDILGDEDHLGDMDFKVAGTEVGVTALQMDIKIDGINEQIMEIALNQAREGRLHILKAMNAVIDKPHQISEFAPRVVTLKINPEKIREVIGKGGATIRALIEETGANIDITDDGTVNISGESVESCEKALKRIQDITADVEMGKIYRGKVVRILDFGAFVNILPNRDGLLHVSQIAQERVENVADYLSEGQEVSVKVLDIDKQGRIKLTMKGL